jgi:lipopolysaccharide transport system ATP-binding protein
MRQNAVIEFDNVSKKFRYGGGHDSLRDLVPAVLRRWWRSSPGQAAGDREFWALREVSFAVGRGESFGIIGPNGAGKSTILKILSGILRPDAGRSAVRGRVSSLIEVGAGFHPDLTGAENVYLNGSVLGMSRREIDAKYGDIVAFAELRDFMDTPIKRYSSGMQARLGFAVAAHMDPEVLLVDEVLSVGDMSFQNRCMERIDRFIHEGTTVVFISHNMQTIARVCQRVIVLSQGRVVCEGPPERAIDHYFRCGPSVAAEKLGRASRRAELLAANLSRVDGSAVEAVRPGDLLRVRARWRFLEAAASVTFGFVLTRLIDGLTVYSANATEMAVAAQTVEPGMEVELVFDLEACLTRGSYGVTLHAKSLEDQSYLDFTRTAVQFEVVENLSFEGVANIDLSCRAAWADPHRGPAAAAESIDELPAGMAWPALGATLG